MNTICWLLAFTGSLTLNPRACGSEMAMNPEIAEYVSAREAEFDQIPSERKQQLRQLADYVRVCRDAGRPARFTFICTHNSRRSHMSQLWAAVAAAHYHLDQVETYSGGTEATAFNPRAISSLRRAGFAIKESEGGANPKYEVAFSKNHPTQVCFSKTYQDESNPQEQFCAVMTCTSADKGCPIVSGASCRIAIPYEDPKAADDTSEESQRYDERSRQIAREMLFAFSLVSEP